MGEKTGGVFQFGVVFVVCGFFLVWFGLVFFFYSNPYSGGVQNSTNLVSH